MRWIDILSGSLMNLLRRKLRSVLTMLGVVIGTAAIVVTLSLGYGAEQTSIAMLEQSNNLKLINVNPYYSYDRGSEDSTSSGRRITKINDSVVRQIRSLSGVDAVTPMKYVWAINISLQTGKYVLEYPNLLAVFPKDFQKMYGLKSGTGFTGNKNQMEFMMAEPKMAEFHDEKKPYEYFDLWMHQRTDKEIPLPDINWLRARYKATMTLYDYSNISDDGEYKSISKEYQAKMVGVIDGIEDYMINQNAIVDINWIKKLYKENKALFKELNITDELETYDQLYVLAKSVDDVSQLATDLRELGVQCWSPMDSIAMIKEQIQTTQMFLGFIGAISMMVAALSIANTMMMSIYERTREIGVMKVLGCKLKNIRLMFLSEAAYIGVFGGFLGLCVSYLLSYALNNVEWLQSLVSNIMNGGYYYGEMSGTTSIIPPQLALVTWAGVIVVSLASGIYPAQRAMQLSSLAAIRNAD